MIGGEGMWGRKSWQSGDFWTIYNGFLPWKSGRKYAKLSEGRMIRASGINIRAVSFLPMHSPHRLKHSRVKRAPNCASTT
jgi:hypothetical protein